MLLFKKSFKSKCEVLILTINEFEELLDYKRSVLGLGIENMR
jgi:hypothetical protein